MPGSKCVGYGLLLFLFVNFSYSQSMVELFKHELPSNIHLNKNLMTIVEKELAERFIQSPSSVFHFLKYVNAIGDSTQKDSLKYFYDYYKYYEMTDKKKYNAIIDRYISEIKSYKFEKYLKKIIKSDFQRHRKIIAKGWLETEPTPLTNNIVNYYWYKYLTSDSTLTYNKLLNYDSLKNQVQDNNILKLKEKLEDVLKSYNPPGHHDFHKIFDYLLYKDIDNLLIVNYNGQEGNQEIGTPATETIDIIDYYFYCYKKQLDILNIYTGPEKRKKSKLLSINLSYFPQRLNVTMHEDISNNKEGVESLSVSVHRKSPMAYNSIGLEKLVLLKKYLIPFSFVAINLSYSKSYGNTVFDLSGKWDNENKSDSYGYGFMIFDKNDYTIKNVNTIALSFSMPVYARYRLLNIEPRLNLYYSRYSFTHNYMYYWVKKVKTDNKWKSYAGGQRLTNDSGYSSNFSIIPNIDIRFTRYRKVNIICSLGYYYSEIRLAYFL